MTRGSENQGSRRPRIRRIRRGFVLVCAVVAALFSWASSAYAGSLSVTVIASSTLTGTVASTLTGILPTATWSDTTGSGSGWNGSVAVSDLTYTGTWVALGASPLLLTAASANFTGTDDGVTYTVQTGTITAGTGSFTYTSDESGDGSGNGSAAGGAAAAVGTRGLTITFGIQSLAPGSSYRIKAGTQPATAVSLNPAATGAAITPSLGTLSPAPTFVGTGTTVPGGGVPQGSYGTAVRFLSAVVATGEGTYTVIPGISVATDASSWAQLYTAGVQYTMSSGP